MIAPKTLAERAADAKSVSPVTANPSIESKVKYFAEVIGNPPERVVIYYDRSMADEEISDIMQAYIDEFQVLVHAEAVDDPEKELKLRESYV